MLKKNGEGKNAKRRKKRTKSQPNGMELLLVNKNRNHSVTKQDIFIKYNKFYAYVQRDKVREREGNHSTKRKLKKLPKHEPFNMKTMKPSLVEIHI